MRLLLIALLLLACDDDSSGGSVDLGQGSPPPLPLDTEPLDSGAPLDMAPRQDLSLRPDLPPLPDRSLPVDRGGFPHSPDADLPGDSCDPRLRAQACGPGFFCGHVMGFGPHIGRCEPGEGCALNQPCPDPLNSYCHLMGNATLCTAPSEREAGEPCVDNEGRPQSCAPGLVCNFSVCQAPCDPGVVDPGCPDEGRCAEISERLGQAAGLCAARGCNWYSGEGCGAGQKCSYAIRSDPNGGYSFVGSCTPDQGQNPEGSPCQFFDEGGHNCAVGLHCVAPPNMEQICRRLCDTGAYEAPCPLGSTCMESLHTHNGPVRGFGICGLNP